MDEVTRLAKEWCDLNVPKPNWIESGSEEAKVDIHQLNERLAGFFFQCYREAYLKGKESKEK